MIETLPEISAMVTREMWSLAAVFLRVGALIWLLPAFGERSVPQRVKLALAFGLTVVCAPSLGLSPDWVEGGVVPVARIIVTEALAGVGFGMLLRFLVHGLQVAGMLAAQSTSLSQIFGGGITPDPQPAMGNALVLGGLTLATMSGLHLRAVEYLLITYELVPFGGLFIASDLAQIGLAQVSRCFALGFVLAGPFVITSVLYNVTLGVINRAMPQLMVAFVGAPAITAAGLIMLALCAPLILTIWVEQLNSVMQAPWSILP